MSRCLSWWCSTNGSLLMAGRGWRVKSSDHVALGRAVRELRKRRGVAQVVLSFDADMDDKYVSKVERGVMNPSFTPLLRIVRALGTTMPELIAVYERHLAEIDPNAGHDVPLCPTPEGLAHARRLSDATLAAYYAAKARKARGRIKPWI